MACDLLRIWFIVAGSKAEGLEEESCSQHGEQETERRSHAHSDTSFDQVLPPSKSAVSPHDPTTSPKPCQGRHQALGGWASGSKL